MDITPGLDYFAAATNIIGKIDDRDSQCYVQVQILTCLYQRQLGLLSKSHAAISEAARALQVILRR
jgi:3-oxoacyl-ACP reductase-like protein